MVMVPLQSVRLYLRSSSIASCAVFSSPQNAVSSRRIASFWSGMLSASAASAVFGGLLLKCMEQMEDRVYNLSLTWEGEAVPKGWVYDQKGWTVFLQEEETVTELIPDGFGDFLGPVEPGQSGCISNWTSVLRNTFLCFPVKTPRRCSTFNKYTKNVR